MSITKQEIKNIQSYKGKSYSIDTRTLEYSLRNITRYVLYWKYLIDNYKGEIRVGGSSIGQAGFAQLKHVSQEGVDDKSPKGILKLQSYLFLENNNFSNDQKIFVNSYIESYYSFMNYLEYKNPIYLSIAILCLDKIQTSIDEDETIITEEEDQGFMYGEDEDEFRGGGEEEDEFREDDYYGDDGGGGSGDEGDFFS